MTPLDFEVVLVGAEDNSGAALIPPFDVPEVFGTRARVPVRGTINGFPFRSSLMPMGGCHRMVVNRTVREGAVVKAGDKVRVHMERDDEARVVEIPPPLRTALSKNKQAQSNWEKLPFTHKKEIAVWITEAKREETRKQRVTKAAQILKTGTRWTG